MERYKSLAQNYTLMGMPFSAYLNFSTYDPYDPVANILGSGSSSDIYS